MANKRGSHIVFFTFLAWGHLRPECALAVSISRKFPSTVITLIVDADFVEKSQKEVKRQCDNDERDGICSRIRIIALGRAVLNGATPASSAAFAATDPRDLRVVPLHVQERIQAVFPNIIGDEPFTDDNNVSWSPVNTRPSLLLSDIQNGDVVMPIKQQYGLPLLIWWFGSAAAFRRAYAPVQWFGRGLDYIREVESTFADDNLRKGRSFSELVKELRECSTRIPDNIIRIKGLPLYYQWEDIPQDFYHPVMFDAIKTASTLTEAADGVLLPAVLGLEADGVEGLTDWYNADGKRQVLCVGPQLPREYLTVREHANKKPQSLSETNHVSGHGDMSSEALVDSCITFLDKVNLIHGAHSAIYISFGSVFWPSVTHLQIFLEALLGLEIAMPFIITMAAPHASIPENVTDRIRSSGKGLVMPWAPQQAVISHPAIGWVLSHCGGGGMWEALSQGVPLIAWPFAGDQPMHARWLSLDLDVAFELIQTRSGPRAALKMYRGGPEGTRIIGTDAAVRAEMEDVLKRCQGEDGRRKRTNALNARRAILEAVKPGGQADQHLERLALYLA